jgi:protein-disulfide isomerase
MAYTNRQAFCFYDGHLRQSGVNIEPSHLTKENGNSTMTRKKTALYNYLLLGFFAACLSILVPQPAAAQTKKPPELLSNYVAQKNGELYFMGNKYGLDGWAVDIDGGRSYAYSTPEGGVVFGLLMSSSEEVVTQEQAQTLRNKLADQALTQEAQQNLLEKLNLTDDGGTEQSGDTKQAVAPVKASPSPAAAPQQAASKKSDKPAQDTKKSGKSEIFYSIVEQADWFSVGNANAPYIYIFMNPTCEHCIAYWNDLKPHIDSGAIQLRILPFGSSADNKTASAALLSVSDPVKAWGSYTGGDKSALSEDKITDKSAYDKVAANTDIWMKWKLRTTPFSVYRSPSDSKIKILIGKPDNTLLLLSDFIR